MKLTKLRRIEGDVNALRSELQQALGMEQKEVTINQLTRHIIVKVWTLALLVTFWVYGFMELFANI